MSDEGLLGRYEVKQRGEGSNVLVADIWHVSRNVHGGSISTPIGWLSVALIPWEGEAPEHWRARLFLLDSQRQLSDERLPEALTDWLKRSSRLSEPFVLEVYDVHYRRFISEGDLHDGD
jgi:hypothetical protein